MRGCTPTQGWALGRGVAFPPCPVAHSPLLSLSAGLDSTAQAPVRFLAPISIPWLCSLFPLHVLTLSATKPSGMGTDSPAPQLWGAQGCVRLMEARTPPRLKVGTSGPTQEQGGLSAVVPQEHSPPQVCAQSLLGILEALSPLSSSPRVTNFTAGLLPERLERDLAQEGFCIAMLYDFTIRGTGYKLPTCGS